jgi:hypothetical protein
LVAQLAQQRIYCKNLLESSITTVNTVQKYWSRLTLTEWTLTERTSIDISRIEIDRIISLKPRTDIDRMDSDRLRNRPNFFLPVKTLTGCRYKKDLHFNDREKHSSCLQNGLQFHPRKACEAKSQNVTDFEKSLRKALRQAFPNSEHSSIS